MTRERQTAIDEIQSEVEIVRRELKNIRQECLKQKASLKAEIAQIKDILTTPRMTSEECACKQKGVTSSFSMTPIGYISSCFKHKNGIPRQSSLCPGARGTLKIEKGVFTNPEHSLIGLGEFSHVWILFVFHENGNRASTKAKVHPPRLNGSTVGVFSTRSPHRPCAIGLSLTKLDKIEGSTLHLSGIDLLHGTPVLDIKPYIPVYDVPSNSELAITEDCTQVSLGQNRAPSGSLPKNSNAALKTSNVLSVTEDTNGCLPESECLAPSVATYLRTGEQYLDVLFTDRAQKDLETFHPAGSHEGRCRHCLDFPSHVEARQSITDVLRNDPRSTYRRQKCADRLYYFCLSELHVTCWFDEDCLVEVLRVRPVCDRTSEDLAT